MKTKHVYASAIPIIVILVIGITYTILFQNHEKSDFDHGKSQSESGTAFKPTISSRERGDPRPNAEALKELKKSWRELYLTREARLGHIGEEHRELALASVRRLGCSYELFQLIDYVNDTKMTGAKSSLVKAAQNLFKDGDIGSELRDSLVDTIRNHDHPLMENLCFYAVYGCDSSDVGLFIPRIEKPNMKKSAELGWGLRMAQDDLPAGLEHVLTILGQPTSSIYESQVLVDLVGLATEDIDHKSIYETIERSNIRADKSRSQVELVRLWAASRPEDVAEYLMKNHADESYLSVVSEVYLKANPVEAVEWVQNLPEGKYRDYAILGQIVDLTNDTLSAAPQLTELVSSPQIKKKCLDLIKQINRGPESK